MLMVKQQKQKCFRMVLTSLSLLICPSDKGSADFEEFLKFMGQKVELASWEGYRGGLDKESKLRCDSDSEKETELILFSTDMKILKLCFMFLHY